MASNPMQRKTRNSFLLGVIITLLIASIIIGILFTQLKQKSDELNAELNAKVNVYALNQNVKSGQILTEDMFVLKRIHKDSIPSDATSLASVIDSWFLQTKEGESVKTDQKGLYLDRTTETSDNIVEIFQNSGTDYNASLKDSKGNLIGKDEKFVCINGVIDKVPSNVKEIQDDNGAFYEDKNNDTQTRVFEEPLTGQFYIYKLDNSAMSTATKREKVYIDMNNVPVLAKVAMNANTVVTPNLVVQSDEVVTDDVRQQEYNVIALPVDLMTDDYIDIRLMTPSGQDFIVVSKAKVDVPMNNDGTYIADTIRVNLREDEILAMSSALVEAYGLKGSKIYATKYVEAGMQKPSLPTYTPSNAVTALIQSNPNIVEIAQEELRTRYSEAAKNMRNSYLQSLIDSTDQEMYKDNIIEKQDGSITNEKAARQKYLQSLND